MDIKSLINQRRNQILVHSCLYYRFNENIISDATYDQFARQLVQLQKDYPEIAKECSYHEYFVGFEGSGFDLPQHLPNIVRKAMWLLDYHKKK